MRLIILFVISILAVWGCQSSNTFSESDWAYPGGSGGQTKYSSLKQINKSNVANLEVAWIFNSGVPSGNVQMNPLIVGGKVYVTTPLQEVIAVDGTTGKQVWRFNPARKDEQFGGINRGISFWRKKGERERIFFTSGGFLNAIYAQDGSPVPEFGDQGRVSLNEGLVKPPEKMGISSPGAPVIFGDLVIVGAMTWASPANVSAFNVYTGERVWIFHTIPQPGEYGYESWGNKDFWKTGAGVNVWGGLSVDEENGMVYFATGQPKDDFYRPDNGGEHLFGNSIVALNAKTGERLWHYQVIHHDLWDLDLPCAPILATLRKDGKEIPGVIQLTKTGNVFMFNRLTGELLSDVEERPVPVSTLPGQYAFPTQPFVKWPEPFSKQVVTADDLTNISEKAHADALEQFHRAEAGWYVPPSTKGIIYYGIHGGAEWGGGSYDPIENVMYVNSNELAWHIVMRDINDANTAANTGEHTKQHAGRSVFLSSGCASCHGADRQGLGGTPVLRNLSGKYTQKEVVDIIKKGKGAMPPFAHLPEDDVQLVASYLLDIEVSGKEQKESSKPYFRSTGYNKFLDQQGYPATAPPWGTLNAIDLESGKIKWKVPLGEYPELTAQGIPITGTENFGGSIVTAGGLVFVGATRDECFRAFDKDTGKMLWEAKLPFGGFAVPSTYQVNGKQYVIIPATGGGKLGTPTGDAYVAFALPASIVKK
ncbi:MAG: pyrroloquinoline quinone-dependent dehydrogenase [Parapedobacter sp.]|nr:MAG: pyrroloquinoline quinone-dependent dehydrogenase [Parapedobacter sp.]